MKIGIDLTSLRRNKLGGGEYYILNLLEGLNQTSSSLENITFYLFCNNIYKGLSAYNPNKFKIIHCNYPYSHFNLKSILYLLIFPLFIKKYDLDLIFYPFTSRPLYNLSHTKSIGVIHDIQRLILKGNTSGFFKKVYLDFMNNLSIKKNIKTVTISKNARDEIISFFNNEDKIVTIYNPIKFSELSTISARLYFKNYLLYVGSLRPHKNIETLIRAFNILIKRNDNINHDLLIIGVKQTTDNKIFKIIDELGISERIKIIGYVTDKDLINYYHFASLFVFPSIYEGFGMPLIEAMHYKLPVLASRRSCIPEVTDNLVNYVDDAFNPHEWSMSIKKILTSSKDKQKLEYLSNHVNEKYDLNVIGRQYLKLFCDEIETSANK